MSFPRLFPRACGTALAIPLILSLHGMQPTQGAEPAKQEGRTAAAVLEKMLATYRNAKSYQDQGLTTITLATPDGEQSGEFDAKLTFERPNRFRLEFQPPIPPDGELVQRLIISDGKRVLTRTDNFPQQVLVTKAPDKDVAPTLFDSKTLGPLLTDELVGGNFMFKLLSSGTLPAPLDAKSAKLLDPADDQGVKLDRLEFPGKEGKWVLWIDPKSSLLRRVDYPADPFFEKLKPLGVTGGAIFTRLTDAKIDAPLPAETFAWTKEAADHYVKELIPPAAADPAAELLGTPAPNFKFTSSDGKKEDRKALDGKVVVIDFWATWCGWCLKGMPHVDKVRQKYADNGKVRFLALSEDADDVTDQQLADTLKQIKVDMPWGRLTAAASEELNNDLSFAGIPAMIVLGTDGRIQYHHVGFDPKVEENLPPVIDALLAGKDPSLQAKTSHEAKIKEFQQRLKAVRVDGP